MAMVDMRKDGLLVRLITIILYKKFQSTRDYESVHGNVLWKGCIMK